MNSNTLTLREIKSGEKCKVEDLLSKGKARNRLLDLGFVKNSIIEVLQKSPSGDPVAYFVKGCVIALRSEDAENILVREI